MTVESNHVRSIYHIVPLIDERLFNREKKKVSAPRSPVMVTPRLTPK